MKLSALLLIAALSGCAVVDTSSPLVTASRNMSEAEVRHLPANTRFEDVDKRLRYFTRSAVAIPLISFAVEGQEETECMMWYDERSGLLSLAWLTRKGSQNPEEAVVVWPKSSAGKKLSDIEEKVWTGKPEANKTPLPTPVERPPSKHDQVPGAADL